MSVQRRSTVYDAGPTNRHIFLLPDKLGHPFLLGPARNLNSLLAEPAVLSSVCISKGSTFPAVIHSNLETLTQYCFNARPASATLPQHGNNIWPTSRFCWVRNQCSLHFLEPSISSHCWFNHYPFIIKKRITNSPKRMLYSN